MLFTVTAGIPEDPAATGPASIIGLENADTFAVVASARANVAGANAGEADILSHDGGRGNLIRLIHPITADTADATRSNAERTAAIGLSAARIAEAITFLRPSVRFHRF